MIINNGHYDRDILLKKIEFNDVLYTYLLNLNGIMAIIFIEARKLSSS